MRLASFGFEGTPRYGVVTDDGVVDLAERLAVPDLKTALAEGRAAIDKHAGAAPDWSLTEVTWLPTIPNPMHVVGLGLNTKSHFEETAELQNRRPGDYPTHPRLFTRSPLSLVGHLQAMAVPHVSPMLDYEGEIALVIGRECRYASPADALDFVAGVSCANDGSVRDFQVHSTQITAGKNFVASGALGPWMTTVDELGDLDTLTLQTRVNGDLRQSCDISDLIFSFAEAVSYISQIYALQPGDVILTGSPAGVGALTGSWLQAGDTIEVAIGGVGVLRNTVVDERAGDAR